MFSPEFMRYLIKYQSNEPCEKTEEKVKYINFKSGGGRLVPVTLLNKK